MAEYDGAESMYLRVYPLHDIVDKNSSIGVNGLPFRFCFFVRKEAWLRENRRSVDISGFLKRSKVRCRLANFPLELLSWPTKGLYQTVVVGRTSDDVFDGANKSSYQFHYLHHWLGGRWIRETRDIIINLLEQPVELAL
jgi:hypothetical protein